MADRLRTVGDHCRLLRALRWTSLSMLLTLHGPVLAAPMPILPITPKLIQVGHHRVAFYITPGRSPALLLDAWGGGDASEWKKLIPQLSKQTGSEIIAYDRAGFGASDEVSGPFDIGNAVQDLTTGLVALGATHDLILVPHSFGGEIATYLAVEHPDWVYGAVLIDTNLPNFYTDEQTERQYEEAKPLIAAMIKKQGLTKRTRSIAAMIDSQVEINHAFHKLTWPPRIPCIVILSQDTPFTSPVEVRLWKQAHIDFAAAEPNRSLVIARHSSHDVVQDRPDVIVDSVSRMVTMFRAGANKH